MSAPVLELPDSASPDTEAFTEFLPEVGRPDSAQTEQFAAVEPADSFTPTPAEALFAINRAIDSRNNIIFNSEGQRYTSPEIDDARKDVIHALGGVVANEVAQTDEFANVQTGKHFQELKRTSPRMPKLPAEWTQIIRSESSVDIANMPDEQFEAHLAIGNRQSEADRKHTEYLRWEAIKEFSFESPQKTVELSPVTVALAKAALAASVELDTAPIVVKAGQESGASDDDISQIREALEKNRAIDKRLYAATDKWLEKSVKQVAAAPEQAAATVTPEQTAPLQNVIAMPKQRIGQRLRSTLHRIRPVKHHANTGRHRLPKVA